MTFSSLSTLDYFTKVLEDDLKAVVKPQYVDQLPKAVKGPDKSVESLIKARSQMGNMDHIMDVLGEEQNPRNFPARANLLQSSTR